MKLWEIKAQSLRLMFADTDIDFSEDEFSNGAIYENANTKEKLVRMEDSIRRAIDTYYHYVGEPTKTNDFTLLYDNVGGIYMNVIDVSNDTMFGYPTRVDAYIYETVTDDNNVETQELRKIVNQVNFNFDRFINTIFFDWFNNYTVHENNVKFKVWYKIKKLNIPSDVLEMSYDLDTLYIPVEVQRMIPYFVKGELFEEDEPNIAINSKNQYVQFLMGLKKPFSQAQTKVKRARIFDK